MGLLPALNFSPVVKHPVKPRDVLIPLVHCSIAALTLCDARFTHRTEILAFYNVDRNLVVPLLDVLLRARVSLMARTARYTGTALVGQ